MPQAAAGAVVAWLAGVGASATTMIAAYYVVQIVVIAAINYGLSQLSRSLAGKPRRPQQFGAGAGPSREVTARSTVEPMQKIYGQIRTPGYMAFFTTSELDNRYMHYVVVFAAHQCEEISDIWLDNRRIPSADIDPATGAVSTAEFMTETGLNGCHIWKHLGTSAQAADITLQLASTEWTNAHRGSGVCYVHIRMDRSEKVWPTGAPQNVFGLVKGKRVYDPRLDSTNGGSGSHRYTDATTWTWSQNWALCIRDYICGGSRWYDVATPEPRLGFAESNAKIDDSYTIAAANIADEDVTIPASGGGTTTQKRYTCDIQISCGDTHRENLEAMLTGGVGELTYVNGRYRIYAGAYDTPTVSIDEDDILGPVTVSTHPSGDENYNFVTGTYYDEDRDWSQSPFPNITNASYETEDGGQYKRSIRLPATRTSYRAQRIGMLHLRQSRNKTTVRFDRLSLKAMDISQHETFTVTISEYGWSSKVFRCLEWEWLPDGFVAISAREETSSFYTDPLTTEYASGPNVTVATPQYDLPTTPVSFTVTPRVQSVHLQWSHGSAAVNNNVVFSVYQYTASTPFSSATKVWSGKATSVDIPLDAGQTRYFWVTSTLNGQESAATPAGAGTAGVAAGMGSIFVARGNCQIGDTNIVKVGGASAYDSDAYSIHGYTSCHLSYKLNDLNTHVLVGLSTNPSLDTNYTSINYAWHYSSAAAGGDGTWYIYESGVSAYSTGVTGSTKDVPLVTYDGTTIRYYLNSSLMRSVVNAGLTLYADSAFNLPGSGINSVVFGPTTNLDVMDTPQLGANAATDVASQEVADGSANVGAIASGTLFTSRVTVATASYTNSTGGTVSVTASFTGEWQAEDNGASMPAITIRAEVTGSVSKTNYVTMVPDATHVVLSGKNTFTLTNGQSITISVIRQAAAFTSAACNVTYRGVGVSIEAIKR